MYRSFQRIRDRLASLGDSFVGDPPDAATVPYTFVWGQFPYEAHEFLSGSGRVVDVEIHVTCVAESPANVLALTSHVERILAGWEPVVPGWRVFPLEVTGSEPVQTARGVFEPSTNRYPAWVVTHLRIRAVKTSEKDGDADGDETGVE